MPIPHCRTDGTLHLDLRESVTRAAKEQQMRAADVYMRTFTSARLNGATLDDASQQARAAFDRANTPDEAA